MPQIISGQLAVYTSDLGGDYNDFGFKIREDKLALIVGATIRTPGVCSGAGGLFSPRALICEYPDGSTIRYPLGIDNLANIVAAISIFRADGAVCIHLDGEEWTTLPPSLVGATSVASTPLDPEPGFADKENGTSDYESIVQGAIRIKYSMERTPGVAFSNLRSCLENIQVGTIGCAQIQGFQPRYIKATQIRATGNGKVVRKGSIPAKADIAACAAAQYGTWAACVGYKGESVRNLHLLFPV